MTVSLHNIRPAPEVTRAERGTHELHRRIIHPLRKLSKNKAFAALNLIDEAGNVDIDKVYQHLKPIAAKCSAPITLPVVGTLTFTEQDVDSLYTHIMQS